MKSVLLNNATLVLPGGIQEHSSVLVADGKIASIVGQGVGAKADVSIDLANQRLFPGFIDVHNHGAVGTDVMDATQTDLDKISRYLASQGVTGWLPTTVPASDENYVRVRQAVEGAMQKQGNGARVLGMHYEGPFVNTSLCGALHKDYFKSYSGPADLTNLHSPATGAKMITVAPEVDGGINLISELSRRGWIISIGHTKADVTVLDAAFENGASHMTHFMNAMSPLHHRSPGPIGWGLSRDDVSCDIIADGVHLDPSILRLLVKVKGAKCLSLISDAIAAAGVGDGEYQIWGETIVVKAGRTSNAAGSIAGSVISMLDAVRMMQSIGVSDVEIAQMASTNPARLLKLEHECGSIEEGKRADLVAIDANGEVQLTVIGGEIVHLIS
jgi:N-acetylglucosamine-6-phosphate deacetylase